MAARDGGLAALLSGMTGSQGKNALLGPNLTCTARTSSMRYRKIAPYLFLLPMIVGLFVFRLGPIAAAVFASFTNWNVATAPVFIGLGNFRELFASQYFWLVLRNTVVFILIFTPGVMILAFIMAVLVNQKLK